MAEEGSSSFSSFWQRSVDKVSKAAKAIPNVSNSGNSGKSGDEQDLKDLTPKQRRRAQVRKAQIEHRQRKENYVKHLEQDIIDLRDMINKTETEAASFKRQNESIRNKLSSLTVTAHKPTSSSANRADSIPAISTELPYEQPISLPLSSSTQWTLNPSPSSAVVSINFDEFIDATCLQISDEDVQQLENDTLMTSSDIYFPNETLTTTMLASNQITQAPLESMSALSRPLPDLSGHGKQKATQPNNQNMETIAINFILALEHPCRTHFHSHSTPFDPTGSPSGHELMASTMLYSNAPESVFAAQPIFSPHATDLSPSIIAPPSSKAPLPFPTTATWEVPTPQLDRLFAMAQSLPKNDLEITPVQAWFAMTQKYGVARLFQGDGHVLEALKGGLGRLVKCYAFGAVMDEARFWEVVEDKLGAPGEGVPG